MPTCEMKTHRINFWCIAFPSKPITELLRLGQMAGLNSQKRSKWIEVRRGGAPCLRRMRKVRRALRVRR